MRQQEIEAPDAILSESTCFRTTFPRGPRRKRAAPSLACPTLGLLARGITRWAAVLRVRPGCAGASVGWGGAAWRGGLSGSGVSGASEFVGPGEGTRGTGFLVHDCDLMWLCGAPCRGVIVPVVGVSLRLTMRGPLFAGVAGYPCCRCVVLTVRLRVCKVWLSPLWVCECVRSFCVTLCVGGGECTESVIMRPWVLSEGCYVCAWLWLYDC